MLEDIDPEFSSFPVSLDGFAAWFHFQISDLSGDPNLWLSANQGGWAYNNANYMLLGPAINQILFGQTFEDVVAELAIESGAPTMRALNESRLPRDGRYQAIRHQPNWTLGDPNHPYTAGTQPLFDGTMLPNWNNSASGAWAENTSGLDAQGLAPAVSGRGTYGGHFALSGALLPPGGFESTTEDLGRFFRAVLQDGLLDDASVLFNPDTANGANAMAVSGRCNYPASQQQCMGNRCQYGLGHYMYRNWVIGLGGGDGVESVVFHNLVWDQTYTVSCNVVGNPTAIITPAMILAVIEPNGYACVENNQTNWIECC